MPDHKPPIRIYTDGGADPNPGPGGWGVVILHADSQQIELSGGEANTTNNRMELTAAIEALKSLPAHSEVELYTDSQYLRKGITEWIAGWVVSNWRGSTGKPVLNQDLWMELNRQQKNHQITWQWVKGHAGHRYNERADELATAAMPRPKLVVDEHLTQVLLRVAGPENANFGKFGWAVRLQRGDKVEMLSGSQANTTVNYIHIKALLDALAQIPPQEALQIFTNNSYLHTGITEWVHGWRKGGWQKPEKFKAEWQALDRENAQRQIRWTMVKNDAPDGFDETGNAAREAREGKRS